MAKGWQLGLMLLTHKRCLGILGGIKSNFLSISIEQLLIYQLDQGGKDHDWQGDFTGWFSFLPSDSLLCD